MGKRKISREQELEICRRYEAGESSAEIAADYNMDPSGIRLVLKRNNVKTRSIKEANQLAKSKVEKVYSEEQREFACQKYLEGYSYKQIFEMLGCGSRTSVQSVIESRGLKRPRKKSNRFTHQQLKEICKRYEAGDSAPMIAKEFGTNSSVVCKLLASHGIQARDAAQAKALYHKRNEDAICRLYSSGKTIKEVALQHGRDEADIRSVLAASGIHKQSAIESFAHWQRHEQGNATHTSTCSTELDNAIRADGIFVGSRKTAFYIAPLTEQSKKYRIGIAFDHKLDQILNSGDYIEPILCMWFNSRREAFFFQQAMLIYTRRDVQSPADTSREEFAIHITDPDSLARLGSHLEADLKELGGWCFAATHIPMSPKQRDECLENCRNDLLVHPYGELFAFDEGEKVAGCSFVSSRKTDGESGQLLWTLKCGECGYIFERNASAHFQAFKKRKIVTCGNRTRHASLKYAKRLAQYGRVVPLEEYKGRHTPILHQCLIHGTNAYMSPNSALQGSGPKECCHAESLARANRKDTEHFIDKARKVHGNRYDYSLADYEDGISKVRIVCPLHGIFEKAPNEHYRGGGCPKCTYARFSEEYTEDLRWKRFGKLTVISQAEPTNTQLTRGSYWLVRCACGSDPYVIGAAALRQKGYDARCQRCWKYERWKEGRALPNNKEYNYLTVIRAWGSDPYGGRRLLCNCRCGGQTIKPWSHVISGYAKSCGCIGSGSDSLDRFLEDDSYANEDCFVYLANVDGKYLKPGISNNPINRARVSNGRYRNYHFVSHRLTRCEAWAIEQRLLRETIDAYPQNLDDEYVQWAGSTELRNPLYYDVAWYRKRFEELVDLMASVGWYDLV
jgi:DNA-binding CsgD family transcriptional regulator